MLLPTKFDDNNLELIEDESHSAESFDIELIPSNSKKARHTQYFDEPNHQNTSPNNNHHTNQTVKHVIATAFSNNKLISSNLEKDEMNFHLNVTDFCCNLIESKQLQFMDIIYQVMSTNFKYTRPPTSLQDLRRFYLSGNNSIYKNIPCPSVLEVDNHAYVPLKDIINFGFNTLDAISIIRSSDYNKPYTDELSLIHTQKAKHLLMTINQKYAKTDIDPYVMFVTFWSDDFEINHTRRNHSSTWIKTMSFVASKETSISKHYTNVVALGHKNDNHDIINGRINEELLLLQEVNQCYVAQLQENIPIVIYPLAVLADRPERCALNHTLSYSGNATRRWLYSSLTSPDRIASCRQCYLKRLRNYFPKKMLSQTPNRKCGKCCDFDFLATSRAAEFSVPNKYPTSKHVDSPPLPVGRDIVKDNRTKKLRPIKLSYNILVNGVKAACYNLHTKQWKIVETRTYLKTLGISSSLTEKVIAHAVNNNQNYIDANECVDTVLLPKIWNDKTFSIDQFLETPMHHLFEGIIKSLIEVTMDFLKFNKMWSKYCEIINPILSIIETLKLDFCRVQSFWGSSTDYKPTGWIAENYLGYTRVILILLTYMDEMEIQQSRGFVELKQMIQTSFVLISHLMSRTNVESEYVSDLIKIFLSTCDNFDKEFGHSSNNIPFWYKKSNFVSLLNLPDQIKEYGSVYLYWEGVKERYIQYVKPILKNKRKTGSFLATKLQQLLQQNALDVYKSSFRQTSMKNYLRFNNVYIYSSQTDLIERMTLKEPLAVITRKEEVTECFAIYKLNYTFITVPIIFDDSMGFHNYNLWFAPVSIRDSMTRSFFSLEDIDNLGYVSSLLVISRDRISTDLHKTGYTLLTSEWIVRKQNGRLELPSISKELIGI